MAPREQGQNVTGRSLPTYAERTAHLDAALFARRELSWAKREVARVLDDVEAPYNAFSAGWQYGRFYGVLQCYRHARRDAVSYAREFKSTFYKTPSGANNAQLLYALEGTR